MPLQTPYAYIICYDLKQPTAQYERLFNELKRSPWWWHYLKSTWMVVRYDALVELQPKLVPLIFKGDFMLIMPAKGPAGGWLPKEAWTWIENKVPREW